MSHQMSNRRIWRKCSSTSETQLFPLLSTESPLDYAGFYVEKTLLFTTPALTKQKLTSISDSSGFTSHTEIDQMNSCLEINKSRWSIYIEISDQHTVTQTHTNTGWQTAYVYVCVNLLTLRDSNNPPQAEPTALEYCQHTHTQCWLNDISLDEIQQNRLASDTQTHWIYISILLH